MAMIIAGARYEVLVPSSCSLKDKRQVVRGLVDRLRNRYNCSVAEVAGQDSWQRATIAVACVSATQHHARQLIDAVTRHVEGCLDLEIAEVAIDFFSEGD